MFHNSFLRTWLEGTYPLPDLINLRTCTPDLDLVVWLSINKKIPFHRINEEKIMGLDDAWNANKSYYEEAIKLVPCFEPGMRLEGEDRIDILEALGNPPDVSHPIYIMTVDDGTTEDIVYVGKSSSNHSRFNGGHSAAIKLLDPKYDGIKKNIYLCQVMLYNPTLEYLPLEFIGDKVLAHAILDDVESMLIDEYKPVFNNKKMKTYKVAHTFSVQIQNCGTESSIFKDKFVWGRP